MPPSTYPVSAPAGILDHTGSRRSEGLPVAGGSRVNFNDSSASRPSHDLAGPSDWEDMAWLDNPALGLDNVALEALALDGDVNRFAMTPDELAHFMRDYGG